MAYNVFFQISSKFSNYEPEMQALLSRKIKVLLHIKGDTKIVENGNTVSC